MKGRHHVHAAEHGDPAPRPDANENYDTKEGSKEVAGGASERSQEEEGEAERPDRQTSRSAKHARDRKKDTRRKIIIGGIVLRVAEKNGKFREWLHKEIEKHVKTDRDRELFADILKNKG